MKPHEDNLYECVYLPGLPSLTASNADSPPGSYHSRDLFLPHPTLKDRWKYVSRLDDQVTLVNGEKVLPLSFEGTVKQSIWVGDAVVVGVGRSVPGLLVFRSAEAGNMTDTELLESIWPTIQDANAHMEEFAQIPHTMVAVLPAEAENYRTDKGTLVRDKIHAQYRSVIDALYKRLEEGRSGTLQLDEERTEAVLLRLLEELGLSVYGPSANLFDEGVDSLKAIHLRRKILDTFHVPTRLAQNVVLEMGSVSGLAKHLCALQRGNAIAAKDRELDMRETIQKYSEFERHAPGPQDSYEKSVVSLAYLVPPAQCVVQQANEVTNGDPDGRNGICWCTFALHAAARRPHFAGVLLNAEPFAP